MSRAAVAAKKAAGKPTAIEAKGWFGAHKWLIARRLAQLGFLMLFLSGPLFGLWITKGTLASSRTFDVLPLTDPFIALQTLAAGHLPEMTALIGVAIVVVAYVLVGGRAYCSWVCPINPLTDAVAWLRERLGMDKGWQPPISLRLWLVGGALAASLVSGTVAWEWINPVTVLHRGLVFGTLVSGLGGLLVLAVIAFDLGVSRHGWCGHVCPVGAFYGLIGRLSVLRVSAAKRAACDDCMDCFRVCPEPQVITPALKTTAPVSPVILSSDCTNCGRCIDVCAKDVFRFAHRGDRREDLAGADAGEADLKRVA